MIFSSQDNGYDDDQRFHHNYFASSTNSRRGQSPIDRGSQNRSGWQRSNTKPSAEELQDVIYVGHLNPGVTDMELRDICLRFGPVESVFKRKSAPASTSSDAADVHHYAFVKFKEPAAALRALVGLDGMLIAGSRV
ncbi:hypothetical protein V1512DRAFT_200423 [Lipomyces arxii]|uniref:uncharacterized protein n=1 Tax=Lipomyces arxii TaxID=56418 RepID=UPI0034CDFA90